MHFLLTRKTVVSRFSIVVADKVGINKTLVKQQHRDGTGSEPFRHISSHKGKLEMKFSGSLCKVEIGEIICYVIPLGSGYFVRLNIFVPKGSGAVLDFAIWLAIWGAGGE